MKYFISFFFPILSNLFIFIFFNCKNKYIYAFYIIIYNLSYITSFEWELEK